MTSKPESSPSQFQNFVSFSARVMAAMRSRENQRPDRLFHDPFAAKLAGIEAINFLEQRLSFKDNAYVAVRTRFFDDFLLAATAKASQVVILACGMDARAFRLQWPAGTKIYELDRAEVLEVKEAVLCDVSPTASRCAIAADLSQPWSHLLLENGFQTDRPSVWLLEGLLMYLTEPQVENLLQIVSQLSASGSWLGLDLINTQALDYEPYQGYFQSGVDDPEELLASYGWEATVLQPGDRGAHFGRYPEKFPPRPVPNVGRVFLVQARKEKNNRIGIDNR